MSATQQTINFTRGVPADESYPLEQVAECAAAVIAGPHGTQVMQYGGSRGFPPLREWLAARYSVPAEQVMLANGSLQFIDLVGLALLEPGDTVFVESPTYDRTLTLLRRHHASVVGVAMEPDGPSMEAFEALLQRHQPRLFYTIPDFQNPSGATASLEKRRRLAELAEQYGFWLLEDAPYRPLRYRGEQLPSLFDFASGRTLHMSSFTKQIAPGVRVGYMVGDAGILSQLAKAAEDTYISPNLLGEGTVYEFCRRGWLEPQLERLRELYLPRLEAICEAIRENLPGAEWIEPDGGFFLSVTLGAGITNEILREHAAALKLNLSRGEGFFPNPADGTRFLRLPFCALSPAEIGEGLRRLASAVATATQEAQ
ncbi:MAG TPA: PLP-dependent aminotransferase family protein [Ardenticatenaceae bacterium]|nr:PLP-dependent aminotransferase family protein [Ardenticatenaceae bacterium]